jgi:hypothetical protein
LLVLAPKPPHPAAATTVNVTAVALAVPPANELTVSQAGGGTPELSTVKGVPPVAAEVTEIVCAGPGVYTGPVGLRAQVIVTPDAARADVVAVTVSLTVDVISLVPPALNWITVAPVLAPTHPAVTLTMNDRPAAWFAVLSVVLAGGVTTIPLLGAASVTTIVAEPVNTGEGFTTMVAFAPGPVAVLQVTATVAVAVSTLARNCPTPAAKTNSPASARAYRFFRIAESIEDLP